VYIKNSTELIENGGTSAERMARKLALDALEHALMAVEPSMLVRTKVKMRGGVLHVRERRIELDRYRRVFVLGGGKASAAMAEAMESILGDRITAGLINVPELQAGRSICKIIRLYGATHPLPSEKGERGVLEMLELVGTPDERTLVICLISGGGSALLPLPRDGILLSDKVEVTSALMKAGANIRELNIVRKHLSAVKGGWLAEKLYPSTVISLVISDVIGNRLDSIASGPLSPDPSTFSDAIKVLKKYGLLQRVPARVSKLMRDGAKGTIPDTPKPGSRFFKRVSNVIIGSNQDACIAAERSLRVNGCNPTLLKKSYEGEARVVGRRFGSIPLRDESKVRPKSWVAGGETTVTVLGRGKGGRNQELALGAAMKINGNAGVALISMGTDGVDGPTNAAGAVVDGSTMNRAISKGLDPRASLRRNDTYRLFRELDDLVITGPTGTNVNDVCAIVLN